jgi:hypothetical protein
MAEISSIENLEDLAQKLSKQLDRDVAPEAVVIEPYGFDNRNGWNTHLCSVSGIGPVGFTDGPVAQREGKTWPTCT